MCLPDSKQTSLVGLVHALQRKTIRDRCLVDYPVIKEQINCPPEKKDLLSLLCDQLIDVQFLDSEDGKVEKSAVVEASKNEQATSNANVGEV